MNGHAKPRIIHGVPLGRALGGVLLALLIPACGGGASSGVAVGKVGQGLSAHAQEVPEGAEVCTAKENLASPPTSADKPVSDACRKAQKHDELWRRSLIVLAAYGTTIETLAEGDGDESTGKLEAAQTGVSGSNWIDVEDGPEKAARAAVAKLVDQMSTNTSEGDLAKAVQDAAPHVKTVCDGLVPYLETQARGYSEIQAEVEKKRTGRADRRCGALDSRSICVSDSTADQAVYANTMANLAALQRSHAEARDTVAGFCAAHKKLEAAAAEGRLSDSETYAGIVDALKSSRKAPESAAPSDKPSESPKK
jgi:hypothetical protein